MAKKKELLDEMAIEATSEKTEKLEPVYTLSEFVKAADKVFERAIHPDIITAAFSMAGKADATKEEAANIVSNYLNKEVKVR